MNSFKKVHEDEPEKLEKFAKISKDCESEANGADECEMAANAMICGTRMAKEQKLLEEIPI